MFESQFLSYLQTWLPTNSGLFLQLYLRIFKYFGDIGLHKRNYYFFFFSDTD